ncbi:hypothetical protein IWQ62_000652 [Dispira parvispora]|uniref:BEACH domain-containing protein n=1 Tax=Dispira parvispora TaxID=1520584 RepID=A0A9W8E5T8_9FUNG|nr:hypothetical protein IWQ62_000652 [Dispira parvispora]
MASCDNVLPQDPAHLVTSQLGIDVAYVCQPADPIQRSSTVCVIVEKEWLNALRHRPIPNSDDLPYQTPRGNQVLLRLPQFRWPYATNSHSFSSEKGKMETYGKRPRFQFEALEITVLEKPPKSLPSDLPDTSIKSYSVSNTGWRPKNLKEYLEWVHQNYPSEPSNVVRCPKPHHPVAGISTIWQVLSQFHFGNSTTYYRTMEPPADAEGSEQTGATDKGTISIPELWLQPMDPPIATCSGVTSADEQKACPEMVNFVRPFCIIESPTALFLIHDHCHISLADLLNFSPRFIRSGSRTSFLVYQLTRALDVLHSRGLAHGRLDPANLHLDEHGWLYLATPRGDVTLTPSLSVPRWEPLESNPVTQWIQGRLSNYQYLMTLNHYAGRRMGDPNFYPILPWVTDFSGQRVEDSWRDLTRTKFRINKGDEQLDITFEGPTPHHIPDILSDITYFVYMARRTPVSVLCHFVRSNYEPNEYPRSLHRLYQWTPDECIPEFYTNPMVFRSIHPDMPDMQLPAWAADPEEFVRKHAEALESEQVSRQLHHWIDITFGYKLTGKAAVRAKNVALPLVPGYKEFRKHGVKQIFMEPHPPKLASLFAPFTVPSSPHSTQSDLPISSDSENDEAIDQAVLLTRPVERLSSSCSLGLNEQYFTATPLEESVLGEGNSSNSLGLESVSPDFNTGEQLQETPATALPLYSTTREEHVSAFDSLLAVRELGSSTELTGDNPRTGDGKSRSPSNTRSTESPHPPGSIPKGSIALMQTVAQQSESPVMALDSPTGFATAPSLPGAALNMVTFLDNSEPIRLTADIAPFAFSQSLAHLECVRRFENTYFPEKPLEANQLAFPMPHMAEFHRLGYGNFPKESSNIPSDQVAHAQAQDMLALGRLINTLIPEPGMVQHYRQIQSSDRYRLRGSLFSLFAEDWRDRPNIKEILAELESTLAPLVPGAGFTIPAWLPGVYQFLAEYKQRTAEPLVVSMVMETTRKVLPLIETLDNDGLDLVIPIFTNLLTNPTTRATAVHYLVHVTKWMGHNRCRHTLLKLFLTWFESPTWETIGIMTQPTTAQLLVSSFGLLTFVQQLLPCYLDLFNAHILMQYEEVNQWAMRESVALAAEVPSGQSSDPCLTSSAFVEAALPVSWVDSDGKQTSDDQYEEAEQTGIDPKVNSSQVQQALLHGLVTMGRCLGPILVSKHVTKLFILVLMKTPSAVSVIAAVYRDLDSLFGKFFTVAQLSRLVAPLEGLLNRSKTVTSPAVVLALIVLCQELAYCLPSPMVLEEFNSGLGEALLKVLEFCQTAPHAGLDRWFIARRMVVFLMWLSEGGLDVDDYWEASIEPVVCVYFDLFIAWGSQDTLPEAITSDVVEHLVSDFSRICRVWGYDRIQRSFSQLRTLEQVIQKIHQPHTTLSSLLDAKTRLLTLEIDETLNDAENQSGKGGGEGPMTTLNNLTQLLVHKPLKRSFSLNERLFMSKLGQALPPFGGGSRKPTVSQISTSRHAADSEQGNIAVKPTDETRNEAEVDAGEKDPDQASRLHTPTPLHVTATAHSPQPRLASSSTPLNFSFTTRVGVPSLPQGLFKKPSAPPVIRDDFKNWRRYLMAKSDEVPLHSRFGFHELGLRQYLGHTSKVLCLATNESHRRFLSGSKDRTVKLWSLDAPYESVRDTSSEIAVHQGNVPEEEGGAPLTTFAHAHGVRSVYWVHAQEWVGTNDGMVHLWSPTTGTLLHTYKATTQLVADCVPHDHGRLLYAATPDGDIYRLSVLNQEVVGRWRTNLFGPNVFCRSLTVDPHQPYLYAGFSNGSLLTLDQRMGRHVNCTQVTEAGSDITTVRHTLDRQILVKSHHNRRILLYDTEVNGITRSFSSTLGDIVDAHVLNEELIYLTNQNYVTFQPLYEQLSEGYSTKFSASAVKAPLTQMALCPENEVILLGASNGNIHMYA